MFLKYDDVEFETSITDWKTFKLEISEESNISLDGGYTFEPVTNSFALNQSEAARLIEELSEYLNLCGK